jgi:hypothetical protein
MPREADADERFSRIRNVNAVRGACVEETGDRFVDGLEVDDEQRSPIRVREIGRRRLERMKPQNCPVNASISPCGTPAASMRTAN